MGQPATPRTDPSQSCAQCGATIRLPKSKGPPLCFRCRASVGSVLRDEPAGAPFQKIVAPERRAPVDLRRTGLLVALVIVVAAIVYLPERRPVSPTAASAPSSAIAGGSARRSGGVSVMLIDRPPSATTGPAGAASSKP